MKLAFTGSIPLYIPFGRIFVEHSQQAYCRYEKLYPTRNIIYVLDTRYELRNKIKFRKLKIFEEAFKQFFKRSQPCTLNIAFIRRDWKRIFDN